MLDVDTRKRHYHVTEAGKINEFVVQLERSFSMTDTSRFVDKNAMLVREFDRYILEHPDFADKIPDNALVVIQIDGDDEFNQWAKKTGKSVAEKDNPIVYITVTELKPVRSRIEKLRLEMAA